jgi:RNA polymerase sigma factor (sigma-70 family)
MTALEFKYSVEQISPALRPFAFKLTKDIEDANDLVQETLFKAFSNRGKFQNGTNLKAWMYTIMKNTFITNYKRMTRRNTFIDTTENSYYLENERHATSNDAISEFVMDDIQDAIACLNENYRVPFMMHYKGFKYHEIAKKLSLPLGTVKNRIHMARKELQDQLKPYAKA